MRLAALGGRMNAALTTVRRGLLALGGPDAQTAGAGRTSAAGRAGSDNAAGFQFAAPLADADRAADARYPPQ
jgi:hypothetical protein